MKCSVLGCKEKAITSVGKNDEFHFCRDHWRAWSYYYHGFRKASGFGCDGLIHPQNWREAMKEFLEHCRGEIAALEQLGISKDANIEEAYGAATQLRKRGRGKGVVNHGTRNSSKNSR